MYDTCFELNTLKMWSVESGARPRQAELAEERARPAVTESTLIALNQLEEWVRALLAEGSSALQ